jgi:dTDP-4-amino-4,6-dideoxygalactose transaminase
MSETVRTYLSPPDVTSLEIAAVEKAMKSGWIAPLGPEVDGFERDFATYCGVDHAVALSTGTAAIHLGLLSLGIGPGDEVVVPTLTFAATAFAVAYTGAAPIFVDVETESWNVDVNLLRGLIEDRISKGKKPAAIIPVDLFGRPCDYESLIDLSKFYEIPLVCDSAESLGARFGPDTVGSFGELSVFSFNGNKIITTSGGGMVTTNNPELAARIRFLSTQAREDFPWYEHYEIGYNYRMSNILAAIGRVQLSRMGEILEARLRVRKNYADGFIGNSNIKVIEDPKWGKSNNWLTTIVIDSDDKSNVSEVVRLALESANIEARHVWKPMHQQKAFSRSETWLNGTADAIFSSGLCLPSGQKLTESKQNEIIEIVLTAVK